MSQTKEDVAMATTTAQAVWLFVLASAVSTAWAGPNTITYQGCVMRADGSPVADGAYRMRFRIFDAMTAGTQRWEEIDAAVPVTSGLFSATLGDGTPFGSLFGNNSNLWLEVAIDLNGNGFETNETYAPRQKLAGAAWAMDANSADLLDGYHASAFVRSIAAGAGLLRTGTSNTVTLSANTAYLQRRVTGTAPAGRFVTGINSDGSVVTAADQVGGAGTITGVTAGTGLTGGGASGSVSLAADTSFLQRRVTGTAPAYQFVKAVNADGSVVTSAAITGVAVGTGLTGGGTSGPVTISADTTYLQRRVAQAAPPGSYITAINADGTVVTNVDQVGVGDITGVTAGTGLTGGGTSGSVSLAADTTYLQRRVTGTAPVGQFITRIYGDGSIVSAADTGDISGVTAGTGLTGGGATGNVTLNADATYLQRRVTGTAGAGYYITAINADGSVATAADDTGNDWHLAGNSNATSGTHFLGTTTNAPLDLRVNNQRAMRYAWTNALDAPNVIGGYPGNYYLTGVLGACRRTSGFRGVCEFGFACELTSGSCLSLVRVVCSCQRGENGPPGAFFRPLGSSNRSDGV